MFDPVCPPSVCGLCHQQHWLHDTQLAALPPIVLLGLRLAMGKTGWKSRKSWQIVVQQTRCLLHVQARRWSPGSQSRISMDGRSGCVLHKASSPGEWGSICQPGTPDARGRELSFLFPQWAISLASHTHGIVVAFS